MTEETRYGLVMPFLDAGDSFTHGFECGQIWQKMEHGDTIEAINVHECNEEQIMLIARHFQYKTSFAPTPFVDGWLTFSAERDYSLKRAGGLREVK